MNLLALSHEDERGQPRHTQLRRELGVLIRVELRHAPVAKFVRQCAQHRRDQLARAAPGGKDVNQQWVRSSAISTRSCSSLTTLAWPG